MHNNSNFNYNYYDNKSVYEIIRDRFGNILDENRMEQRRNAIDFKQDNFLDDDQNSAVNNIILKTLNSSMDSRNLSVNEVKTLSLMKTRFKEAFETILKVNRIEDYDSTQNFRRIQDTCSKDSRFTDLKFRACDESIYHSHSFKKYLIDQGRTGPYDRINWKRAKDLVHNSQFAVNEMDPSHYISDPYHINDKNYRNYFQTTDLDQGALGNCWFISAATGIIQNFTLFKRVVPFDNSFEDSVYTGAFHFRFWVYGEWKDVVVDDFLPVGPDNRLIFSKNRESKNEFWCALLEKAYAKICGSYEALEGGFTTDALVDMSGGIEECYNLVDIRNMTLNSHHTMTDIKKPNQNSFWNILISARSKFSVIGCNIEVTKGVDAYRNEVRMTNGLVQGHAYIVTKAAELEINRKTYRLLRLYNPWGNDVEWNGEWSDRSSIWRMISNNVKDELELKIENDGEFWMSYEDWMRNFDFCQICNLTPDTISDITEHDWQNARVLSNIFSMWQCQVFHGKWIKHISAGGCGQYNESKFWTNPQYTFVINETDLINNTCYVIIGLMQKYTRQKRIKLNVDSAEEYIQFRIYKVTQLNVFHSCISNGEPIDSSELERAGSSGAYTNKREVNGRFALGVGAYLIVPSCFDEDIDGEFMIRIFTEKPLSRGPVAPIERCPTVICRNKSKASFESDTLRDLSSLSIGASNIIDQFLYIASDYGKLASFNGRKNSFANMGDPTSRNYNQNDTNRHSFSGSIENGFPVYNPSANRRSKLTPQVSCNQM